MFCSKCGKEVAEKQNICSYCGNSIISEMKIFTEANRMHSISSKIKQLL